MLFYMLQSYNSLPTLPRALFACDSCVAPLLSQQRRNRKVKDAPCVYAHVPDLFFAKDSDQLARAHADPDTNPLEKHMQTHTHTQRSRLVSGLWADSFH